MRAARVADGGQHPVTGCGESGGSFAEFLAAAWRAGVLRYVADFDAREVTYHSWNGENYVEPYPDAATGQPPDL